MPNFNDENFCTAFRVELVNIFSAFGRVASAATRFVSEETVNAQIEKRINNCNQYRIPGIQTPANEMTFNKLFPLIVRANPYSPALANTHNSYSPIQRQGMSSSFAPAAQPYYYSDPALGQPYPPQGPYYSSSNQLSPDNIPFFHSGKPVAPPYPPQDHPYGYPSPSQLQQSFSSYPPPFQ